jgi:hypothetical protein
MPSYFIPMRFLCRRIVTCFFLTMLSCTGNSSRSGNLASVKYHPNGAISHCRVVRDTLIGNIPVPGKSVLWFDTAGVLTGVTFSRDVFCQGIPCKGVWWDFVQTTFYPDGRISGTILSEDAVIQGIPCKSSLFAPVYLDKDGRLSKCRLSRDYARDGSTWKKGAMIAISPEAGIAQTK